MIISSVSMTFVNGIGTLKRMRRIGIEISTAIRPKMLLVSSDTTGPAVGFVAPEDVSPMVAGKHLRFALLIIADASTNDTSRRRAVHEPDEVAVEIPRFLLPSRIMNAGLEDHRHHEAMIAEVSIRRSSPPLSLKFENIVSPPVAFPIGLVTKLIAVLNTEAGPFRPVALVDEQQS